MIQICMRCGREYGRDGRECDGDPNAPTHGFCPGCFAVACAELDAEATCGDAHRGHACMLSPGHAGDHYHNGLAW